ncbi:NAD(P)/FAD-dependent oxidoreductase [Sulfurimonas sp. MAG313]|nr:NAD(P)/FAD-dependent oxidoreductase [Sulfurimonas sp. MAG313]MDF1882230.1 NAD(P)/FAD-dependent oxidoreductase [Sulfurimonas sp. MAG313]
MRIAIIGAGASGLMAGITAKNNRTSIHIYEQNNKPAKKILASGNGRCNISNRHSSSLDYAGFNPSFASYALEQFDFTRLEKFCKSIGLFLNILDDGRAYPLSNEAKSVAFALENAAKHKGVEIYTEHLITSIEKKGKEFYLHTTLNISEPYDKILICTGSQAASQLGGSDSGYELAYALGHSISATYPSLVQLHIDSNLHEKMSGTKQEAEVTLYLNSKKEQSIKGDILFTKYGISGFAILDISQSASEALLNYQNVAIGLDLIPKLDRQALSSQLLSSCQSLSEYTIESILFGYLPVKISRVLLEDLHIPSSTLAKEVHTKMAKKIVSKIKDWRFKISQTHGFKHAEVSGGGILTDEVDEKTMQSKKCEGLYFAGEVLDIVGRRGGFNFAFAFASGHLAALNMSK